MTRRYHWPSQPPSSPSNDASARRAKSQSTNRADARSAAYPSTAGAAARAAAATRCAADGRCAGGCAVIGSAGASAMVSVTALLPRSRRPSLVGRRTPGCATLSLVTKLALLAVDAPSLYFRAFHGIPESAAKTDAGESVNAVRGFLDMIATLIRGRRPDRIVCALDADWR